MIIFSFKNRTILFEIKEFCCNMENKHRTFNVNIKKRSIWTLKIYRNI